MKKELKKCFEEAKSYFSSLSGPKLALVIDGKCLMYALDPSLRVMLLNLSLNCHTVVCCRVSPLQKAQVKLMHHCLLTLLFLLICRHLLSKKLILNQFLAYFDGGAWVYLPYNFLCL